MTRISAQHVNCKFVGLDYSNFQKHSKNITAQIKKITASGYVLGCGDVIWVVQSDIQYKIAYRQFVFEKDNHYVIYWFNEMDDRKVLQGFGNE